MQVLRGLRSVARDFPGCVATIGNFDGVHLGHQTLLASLRQVSTEKAVPTLAMMFEPHPKEFFAPESAPARLSNLREKLQDLAEHKVDYVLCIPFNQAFCSMSATAFIEDILVNALKVKHLIVGDDFRFGCDRSGDYQALTTAGQRFDFGVQDTPTLEHDGDRVSSTRLRAELAKGRLSEVKALLGRPYRMSGRVIYGRQLGRTLDTPTANIAIKRQALALSGVFAVRVIHEDRQFSGKGEHEYLGVANIGVKPTVNNNPEPSLEVHLFGFQGDLYYQHLSVEFLHKIRDEQTFANVIDLQAAIAQDKIAAKQYFSTLTHSFRDQ